MARRPRAKEEEGADGPAAVPASKPKTKLPLPSHEPSTNVLIADIVLRAAGGLLRDRLEKGLITRNHGDDPEAHRIVDKRSVASRAMLWGASSLARRSPLGLAVVAGGLAAKVFYDRGKRIEKRRRTKSSPPSES